MDSFHHPSLIRLYLFAGLVNQHFLPGLAGPTSSLETCQNARGSERLHMFAACINIPQRKNSSNFDKFMENPCVFAILQSLVVGRLDFAKEFPPPPCLGKPEILLLVPFEFCGDSAQKLSIEQHSRLIAQTSQS